MKQIIVAIILVVSFYSCNQEKSKKKTSLSNGKVDSSSRVKESLAKETLDTVVIYWQTEYDTVAKNKKINIGNDIYELDLKSFSLNDSSRVRWNDLNRPTIYKDVYHEYVTDLVLKKDDSVLLTKRINKESFKDSLYGDFYKHSVLRVIEYESIRSNRIYFRAILDVPDTDWMLENDFSIFFRTNKKGQVDYWNFRDVGL